MTDITRLSMAETRAAIAEKRLSAVEIARHFLDRIAASQPVLAGFTMIDEAGALAQAEAIDRKARRGDRLGMLAGVTVSVKDIIDVAGLATTNCSRSCLGRRATRDAALVARLRSEDAVILGKANCHEFAFGGPAFDLPFPPARNPWNPEYFPGGSSSGSGVTLAAGLCQASIGTDTAGSIRLPAGHCGVVGLKPGRDVVPLAGVTPLSPSLDSAGAMARDAADCRLVHGVIADPGQPADAADSRRRAGDFNGLSLGMVDIAEATAHPAHPEIEAAAALLARHFAAGGGRLEAIRLPDPALIQAAASVIMMAEVADHHAAAIHARPQDYGSIFRLRALAGEGISPADRQAAAGVRPMLQAAMAHLFRQVDFIMLPVSATPPGKLAEVDCFYFLGQPNLNILANFLGLPAVTLPCTRSGEGLPIGIQIIGPEGSEAGLLDLAEGLEQHGDFDPGPAMAACGAAPI